MAYPLISLCVLCKIGTTPPARAVTTAGVIATSGVWGYDLACSAPSGLAAWATTRLNRRPLLGVDSGNTIQSPTREFSLSTPDTSLVGQGCEDTEHSP